MSSPPRFVAMRMEWMTGGRRFAPYTLYDSADGVHWRARRDRRTGAMADRSTFFLNPLRSPPQWTLSLRENLCTAGPSGHMRARRYWEMPHEQLLDRPGDGWLDPQEQRGGPPAVHGGPTPPHAAAAAAQPMPSMPSTPSTSSTSSAASSALYTPYRPFLRKFFQCEAHRPGEPVPWLAVDRDDCGFKECDLYNVDGIAYESLMLHGLAVLRGRRNEMETKDNAIHLGFSRDGFHVSRPPPPCATATTATATTAPAVTAAIPFDANADADVDANSNTGVGRCRRSELGALGSRLGRAARRRGRPVGGGGGSGGRGGSSGASGASGAGRRRTPFIEVSCAQWFPQLPQLRVLCANLQLAQGSPLVAGDRLLFYFGYAGREMREVRDGEAEGEGEGASSARRRESKRAGGRGARPTPPLGGSTKRGDLKNRSKYFEATGLAVLRRDGFASLAPRDEAAPAQLTTRPLSFNGSHLFVNVVLGPAGWLRVEVLPPRGGGDAPLCGFGARDAVPLRGPLDSTRVALPAWRGGVPLSRFAGAAVRPAGLKWCQPSVITAPRRSSGYP